MGSGGGRPTAKEEFFKMVRKNGQLTQMPLTYCSVCPIAIAAEVVAGWTSASRKVNMTGKPLSRHCFVHNKANSYIRTVRCGILQILAKWYYPGKCFGWSRMSGRRLGLPGQVWELRFLPSFPSFLRENQKVSWKTPGSPRRSSTRHPRPASCS